MRGRKTGLRVVSWFLVLAMIFQMVSSDFLTTANATYAEPEAIMDAMLDADTVSDNALTQDTETTQADPQMQETDTIETETEGESEEENGEESVETVPETGIELICKDYSSSSVKLAWTVEEGAKAVNYEIYRDAASIGTVKAGEQTEYAYEDTSDITTNSSYTYQVFGLDAEGKKITGSKSVVVEIIEDWVISSYTTLTENKTIRNLKIQNGYTLDLGEYELNVLGDIDIQKGCLNVNQGYAECQNLILGYYGQICMQNVNGLLKVNGNISFSSSYLYYNSTLTAGTLELAGDYLGSNITSSRFCASGKHTLILNGSKKQTISTNSNGYCPFNIIEIDNHSEEGVYFQGLIPGADVRTNGCNFTTDFEYAQKGWLLEEDEVIDGDLVLVTDTLDLNGHKLTIKGDLIQVGGIVDINNGCLVVEGDYYVEYKKSDDGNDSFVKSTGSLLMNDDKDEIHVSGLFQMGSLISHENLLTNGKLYVGGDVRQKYNGNYYNFLSTGKFTLVFCGDKEQTITFANSSYSCSRVANLEITNEVEKGVKIPSVVLFVSGNINDHGNAVDGKISPYLNTTTFTEQAFAGDLYITSNSYRLNADLTIGGNLYIQQSLYVNGKKLTVNGDVTVSSTLYNNNVNDYMLVKGNMNLTNGSLYLYNGTLEIKGDFTQTATSGTYMNAAIDHTTLFSGEKKQTVIINSSANSFGKVVLTNTSEEGIYAPKGLPALAIERNGVKITGDNIGETGYQLTENTVINGDFYLANGDMDLNGHTLTVSGNLIQSGGNMQINGGKLIVQGDYRLESEKLGEDEQPVYSACVGYLYMTKESDYISVAGDFVMGVGGSESGKLTYGTLEVKGNVIQKYYGNPANFSTGTNFKLLLSGNEKQEIDIPANIGTSSGVGHLEITNTGEEGVVIKNGYLYVMTSVNDHGKKVSGNIYVNYNTTFANNCFSGGLTVSSLSLTDRELTIGGDLQITSSVSLQSSKVVVQGNVSVSSGGGICLYDNGKMYIRGDLNIADTSSYSYGYYCYNDTGYLLVEGNMTVSRYGKYYHGPTAGTLELKGDFTQINYSGYNGFFCSGTHTTILSGDKKQTILFNNPACMFNNVVIQNTSEEGIYAPNDLNANKITFNGCRVDCGQEGETGFTLTEDTEIEGDYTLAFGDMNLNGHTLHITGDFYHAGGNLNVQGGKLRIDGSYRMQNRKVAEDGTETFGGSVGSLIMTDANDLVEVYGDLVMGSIYGSSGRLTAGRMNVKGNVSQITYKSNQNFLSTDNFVLELSGEKAQTINFATGTTPYSDTRSDIANLVITNESDEGIILGSNIVRVTKHVKDNGNHITGKLAVGNTTTFENNEFLNDLYIPYSYSMASDLLIDGNLTLGAGSLNVNAYTLHVTGDFVAESGYYQNGSSSFYGTTSLNMTNAKSYVLIDGSMTVGTYYSNSGMMTNGVLEIKGDFTQKKYAGGYANNFVCGENHRTILSGEQMQTVKFESAQSTFGILELKNTSMEGVYFDCPTINALTLIKNDTYVRQSGDGIVGYTLTEDTYVEGDLNLLSGDLDLNGYSLKVSGNMYVGSGTLTINKGSLVVEGDLRIQAPQFDADHKVTGYVQGYGLLVMNKPEDSVLVKGSFAVQSQKNTNGYLTDGTLEVKGNFEQISSGSYSFLATENHKVILSGQNKQAIRMDNYNYFNILEIKNTSSEGVTLWNNNSIYVQKSLSDEGSKLAKTGMITIPSLDVLSGEACGGNITVSKSSTLERDMQIAGNLTMNNSLDLAGFSLTTGDLTMRAGTLNINGGSLTVIGSLKLSGDYTYLKMTNKEDYICVSKDFSTFSRQNHASYLTNGTLEIRGNFTQNYDYYNFHASGEHRTVFSGKTGTANRNYVQQITINYPAKNHFNHVVLNKPEKYYIFTPELEKICTSYENEAKDDEAPEKVQNVAITNVTATKITLSWDAATEDSDVTGYEVYRNGAKVGTTSRTTFTDNGLKPSSTYTYKVYAFDAMRNLSPASDTVSSMTKADTVAPSVPSAIKIKTKTGSSISVTWNASTDEVGVAGYKVYRDGEEIAKLGSTTLFKDREVEEDTIYTYEVVAFDSSGNESARSESVKGSVAMPEILRFNPADNTEIGGGKVTLVAYFKNVGNSTGNKVKFEYKTKNTVGEEVWELIGGIAYGQQTYNATTHYASCVWDYRHIKNDAVNMRITLIDADGNTDCEEYSLHIDTEGPLPTDEIRMESLNGNVQLTWNESDSADCVKYHVYRSDSEKGIDALIATVNENKFEDKTVKEGNTYYYCIAGVDAFNQIGEKSKKEKIEVTKDDELPKVVSISVADKRVNGIANIEVVGSDNRSVKEIILDYQDPETKEWIALGTQQATEDKATFVWDTRGMEDGKYQLRAVSVDTSDNRSDAKQVVGDYEFQLEPFYATVTLDNTGIAKIRINSAVGYPTYVTLKWDNVQEEDFSHFVVEQKSGDSYTQVATTSTTLGIHIQNLMLNTAYTFRVVGYDNLGNRGIPSDDVVVTTTQDDQKPIITNFGPAEKYFASQIPLSVKVTDNVGVKSLKLTYSQDQENWIDLATLIADKTQKEYTFQYDFDVSELAEGNVFVRAYAYDIYDNESSYEEEPIVNNFTIDRTAPQKVTGVQAQGMSGYNEIKWDRMDEKDIKEFRLYRAEEEIGSYSLIQGSIGTNVYYDTTAKIGVVYCYRVAAVDLAGNVGEQSVEAVAQCYVDTEKPIVHAITPQNDSKITGKAKIKAIVSDNVSVDHVYFEYKPVNSEEDIWTELADVTISSVTGYPEVTWDVTKFENTSYELRVTAYDISENISKPLTVIYKVDTKAPQAPTLQGEAIGFGAKLAWNANEESDFDHYEVYRRLGSETAFTLLTETTETSYEDTLLQSGRKYHYKIYAYDDAKNRSESNTVIVVPTDEDNEAPVAVASETLSVRVGSELRLDGTGSHDNVKIAKYEWDMGNGDKVYGAITRYTYQEMGTYQAKLTVTDTSGNTDSTDITVHVRSRISAKVNLKVNGAYGSSSMSLGYAYIYIESEFGEKSYYNADCYGELSVVLAAGTYTVDAYKEGYMPKSFTITVGKGDEQSEVLTLEKGELVTGKLTTTRLTLKEIMDLGVDLQDPNNWYTYYYTLTYTVPGTPVRESVRVPLVPGRVTYVGNGGGYYIHLYEVEGKKVVTVYRSVSFLKKMYDVCLTVTNNAEDGFGFDIEKSTATLNLPNGLSLLKINRPQRLTNDLDVLHAQETKETHWYIKADEPGNYNLSATFRGNLLPFNAPVETVIKASSPLVVDEKEDNTFTDDGFATNPKDYIIRVTDKQGRKLKGAIVTLQHDGKQCQTITNSRGIAKLVVNQGDGRAFRLTIQMPDFPLYINSAYIAKSNYTDTIKLYREDEEPDPEPEDTTNPYRNHRIRLLAASMDGKDIIRTTRKINWLKDETHTLSFTFANDISSYVISQSASGKDPLASGEVNGNEFSVTFTNSQITRDGSLCMTVYGSDAEGDDTDVFYLLNVSAEKTLFDSVMLNYDGEVYDLLTDAFVAYTYYKDTYLDISCNLIEGLDTSRISGYELTQWDKTKATSTDGNFHVKIRNFETTKSVFLVTYDADGNKITSQKLELGIQSVPDLPTDFKFQLSTDDGIVITVPSDVPFIGGSTLTFKLPEEALPYDYEVSASGVSFTIQPFSKEFDVIPGKVEMEVGVGGKFEAAVDSQDLTGHLLLSFGASGEWEQQLAVGPVPVVVAVEVSGEIEADGSVTLHLDPEAEQLISGALALAIEIGIDLYAGVGVAEVASVGVYGAAALNFDFTVLPWSTQGLDKASVSGEAGLRAKLLFFEGSLPLISGEYVFYNRNLPSADGLSSGTWSTWEEIEAQLSDISNYHVAERGDTSDRSGWNGTVDTNKISVLQQNAYAGAIPQVAAAGEKVIMVYTDDDLSKDVQNGSTLKYAVYSDAGFATPVNVPGTSNSQYGFDICEAEDGAYLVWQEAKTSYGEDTTLAEAAKSLELKAAKIDATGTVTTLGTITNNDSYEAEPQICKIHDQVYVTWYENSEADIFGKKGTNTMKMATLSSSGWTISELAGGLTEIASVDLGNIGQKACVAFTQAGGAKVISLADKSVSTLGNAENMQFGYVATKPSLIWYQDGKVYASSEIGSYNNTLFDDSRIGVKNYQYISDATGNSTIIYSAPKNGKSEIYVSDYDASTKTWCQKQVITEQNAYLENLSGAYRNGELVLGFNQTTATVTSELLGQESIPVKTNLCSMKVEKVGVVKLQDVNFDTKQAIPGGEVSLKLSLYNAGLRRALAEDITYEAYNEKNELVASAKATKAVEPGQLTEDCFKIQLPYTLAESDYLIKVKCGDVTTEKEVAVGDSDLVVSARTYAVGSGYAVEAVVENIGIEPSDGKLIFFDRKNPETAIAERSFEDLNYSETAEEIFTVPEQVYDGSATCSLGVKVESASKDANEKNNIVYVVLTQKDSLAPCVVTFDYRQPGMKKEHRYVVSGNSVEMPIDPKVEGYQFLGWFDGEQKFDPKTAVTKDLTLFAKYEKITTPNAKPNPDNPGQANPGKDNPGKDNPGKDNPGQAPQKDVKKLPAKNAKKTIKGITYKVTKSAKKNGTVMVYKLADKKKTSVTIPATVKIDGYTFKVTEIGKDAFKKRTKITKVSISSTVTKIGTNAFYGCKKLRSVSIKSTKLKSVGKNSFKGISSRATIKVPRKSLQKYKKLFKRAGLPKGAKLKK